MPVSKKRKTKKSKKQKVGMKSKTPIILRHYNSPQSAGGLHSFINMNTTNAEIQELDMNSDKDIEVISEVRRVKFGIPSITFKYKYDGEFYEIDFIDKYTNGLGNEPAVYNAWIIKDDKDVMTMKVLPEHHDMVKEDKCKCILNLYLDKYK